ncbi:hypothetical protein GQ464_007845 [Rhodocaloribacter litoris]|uniref:putative metalloprotease CJM1_0395 family protein n=1 Tax=Rhodocaloribacter litoris TaxID=2558931 RepID=UPI001E576591|nr:putative metalloprotease CJM1_0395 family protein [Rhodocaloribacter litoris]QXD16839.1 hypothetical protein GQ464_007845 [Rhodocaloribacter litoris]
MITSTTSTAASVAVLALHGMPARARQDEAAADRNPAAGPVEPEGTERPHAGRVGAVGAGKELTPAEEEQLRRLKKRDAEVRQHEQAHLLAAGPYAQGPPRYTYQVGPDGKRYAIGGSVKIDTRPVPGDPEATIRKAQVIRRAALAPKDPSPADRRIAHEAGRMEMKARQELELRQREERRARMRQEEGAVPEATPDGPHIFTPVATVPYADTGSRSEGQVGGPQGYAGAYAGTMAREATLEVRPVRRIDRYA